MTDSTPSVNYFREGLIITAITLGVMVALPLFAVAFWALRFVLLVAIPVAVVVFMLSPSAQAWAGFSTAPKLAYKGMSLSPAVSLHPQHSWLRRDTWSEVTIGVDDLTQRALGSLKSVILPPSGASVNKGDVLFTLRAEGRELAVRAPLAGNVVYSNTSLAAKPGLVNEKPYDEGWILKLKANDIRNGLGSFSKGKRAQAWFREEVDRLLACASGNQLPTAALPDGGSVVNDLHKVLDDAAWERVRRDFFGQ